MMVSEQKRALQANANLSTRGAAAGSVAATGTTTATTAASSSPAAAAAAAAGTGTGTGAGTGTATTAVMKAEPTMVTASAAAMADVATTAIASTTSNTATTATAATSGFAPLPFDEALMQSAVAAAAATGGDKSPFFIDTAMLAQQIAAVVSDEKKLSDNIMDLIPPPVTHGVQATPPLGASLTTPLAPPPGLMMRALSPPMSLLPELSQPTPFSLETAAASVAAAASSVTTAVTAPVTSTLPSSELTTSVGAAPTATTAASAPATPAVPATTVVPPPSLLDERRKTNSLAHAALLKKRKSADAFGDSKENPGVPTSSMSSAPPSSLTSLNNSLSSSAGINAAREKVMKEPQSGDLYECVITKRNGGLGLTLACVDDHVQITGLAPDTPAANSGICVGDTLVAVSGLPVRGLQFSTVIGRLKSTSRSSVVLKLRRNPFRQNGGGSAPYRSMKRPARPPAKSAESNSANVLSSKSMALESRLGGGAMNGNSHAADDSHHGQQNGFKMEPMSASYFPTDASILTMGPSGVTDLQWKVCHEDKERYYAECRTLKQELAHVMSARRSEKRDYERYSEQLQDVVDTFQKDIQGTMAKGNEDLVALRQKLLEVNHALAKQQTEILELKEREARHALPESQRVKMQLILLIKKNMQSMDLKAVALACKQSALSLGGDKKCQKFKETIEGIRQSVFDLLCRHDTKPEAPVVELDLDTRACTQTFGWNLREVVSQGNLAYVVFVEDMVHVRYVRAHETLELSWQFKVQEFNY